MSNYIRKRKLLFKKNELEQYVLVGLKALEHNPQSADSRAEANKLAAEAEQSRLEVAREEQESLKERVQKAEEWFKSRKDKPW